jgi:hypothetical protein
MIYFMIVVSVFVSALFVMPSFEDKILVTFQGGNQTLGNDSTITDGGTDASEQAQEEELLGQPVQEEATAAPTQTGTTETTGKDLVILHIKAAIAAA